MTMFSFNMGDNGYAPAPYGPGYLSGIGASQPVAAAAQAQAQSAPATLAPAAVAPPNGFGMNSAATPFGFNLGTGQLLLGGLQAISNFMAARDQNRLARQQFNYTREVTDTNLANQIRSYNTRLEDRVRTRTAMERGQEGGMTEASGAEYMERNRARRGGTL